MIGLAIAVATFLATLAGGLVALRLRDRLHLVLGFSAGAVVAVAFFDLIPEAIDLGAPTYSARTLLAVVALGFLSYLVADRLQGQAKPGAGDGGRDLRRNRRRGVLGAAGLSTHSFLDGVAIGLALQASVAAGAVVGIAVLAHDFADGINTTSVVVRSGGSREQALRWLLLDASTPAAGIVATLFFRVSNPVLGLALAVFAGFFLYLGASDLIPESHHAHPRLLTTAMTLLGAGFLYIAIMLAAP